MRIGLLHPAFGSWGGAEQLLRLLAGGLVERGHQVTVLSGAFSAAARTLLAPTGAQLEELTFMHGRAWSRLGLRSSEGRARLDIAPLWDHVARLDRRAIAEGALGLARRLDRFDAINVHNFPASWWVAEARWRAAGLPPVLWYCNEPSRSLYPGLFEGPSFEFTPSSDPLQQHDRRVGRSFERVAFISGYVARRGAAILGRDDGIVVPAGIALGPATHAVPRRHERLEVLMVNRLVPLKNVAVAIEATGRLPWVSLRVVGEGPELPSLRKLAHERVRFDGFLAEADLPAAYRAADVFLHLPTGEPFGLVLLEAAAHGLPAVASNHGGPSEIVVEGHTGTLVEPTSPDEVAAALTRMADLRSDERRRMGEAARLRVEQLHSAERFVSAVEALLAGGDGRGP